MEKETNIEKQTAFIRENLLGTARALHEAGFVLPSFLIMAQGIEALGAFLDRKPFRTPAQSKVRFALALRELFPEKYTRANGTDFLYRQLRSNLSHLCVASPHLFLCLRAESHAPHLSVRESKTVLVAEDFLEDFENACLKVVSELESGGLFPKFFAAG